MSQESRQIYHDADALAKAAAIAPDSKVA